MCRGRCLGGVLRRRETLTHTGTQRTRGKKSLFVPSAPQAPRRVEFPALSRPRPSITGRRAASALPAAKVAFRQLPPRRAPAAVLRLTLLGLLTEEGGPESQQTLLNWTQSSARNQASGLFLPTQTSTSTKIFQAGRAAFSGMDSSRLESLPHCIFNVLTYSLHGLGLTEAPPYRLPDKWTTNGTNNPSTWKS